MKHWHFTINRQFEGMEPGTYTVKVKHTLTSDEKFGTHFEVTNEIREQPKLEVSGLIEAIDNLQDRLTEINEKLEEL